MFSLICNLFRNTGTTHLHQLSSLQRHPSDVAKPSSPSPLPIIQRTLSYPWVNSSQQTPSIIANSLSPPFQYPNTQLVNSGMPRIWPQQLMYPPQLPSYQPTMYQPPGWSQPTSPYRHSSMPMWSTRPILVSSSLASDLPIRSYSASATPVREQSLQTSTPQHGDGEATAPEDIQQKKKTGGSFRFFTLPIFCSLRRWQKQKKGKKANKKKEETSAAVFPPAQVQAPPQDCERNGYNRYGYPIYSNLNSTKQYFAAQPPQPVLEQEQTRFGDPKETSPLGSSLQSSGDSISFVNRMHMNLSTYRT